MVLILDTAAIIENISGSYINGKLFHAGAGDKFYPIGKAGQYAPTYLFGLTNSGTELTGIEVFNEMVDIPDLPSFYAASQSWHWQVMGNPEGATVQLPVLPEDQANLGTDEGLTILNTDINQENTSDLQGSYDSGTMAISGSQPIRAGYLFLGNRLVTGLIEGLPGLRVYPNPFTDLITLELPEVNRQLVSVFSMVGKKYFEDYYHEKMIIDTSEWNPGTYLLSISGPQQTSIRKLVKVE